MYWTLSSRKAWPCKFVLHIRSVLRTAYLPARSLALLWQHPQVVRRPARHAPAAQHSTTPDTWDAYLGSQGSPWTGQLCHATPAKACLAACYSGALISHLSPAFPSHICAVRCSRDASGSPLLGMRIVCCHSKVGLGMQDPESAWCSPGQQVLRIVEPKAALQPAPPGALHVVNASLLAAPTWLQRPPDCL